MGYNGKDICKISVNIATIALQNLNHYRNIFQEFLIVKDFLKYELKILNIKHNVEYGNFFTIFVENPKYVCYLFQKNRISIRNKDSEIKGAIRISIAPLDIMKRVIKILQMCLRFKNKNTWIFDLDGTLRKYSKLTSEVYLGAKKNVK